MEKSKKVWGTMFNYKAQKGQTSTKPHLTVPDMSLTVTDILKKALGGNLPALSRNVAYGGNTYVHSIPIDITEVETSARNLKRRIDAQKEAEEAEIQAKNKQKAELERIQREEFETWKKQQPS